MRRRRLIEEESEGRAAIESFHARHPVAEQVLVIPCTPWQFARFHAAASSAGLSIEAWVKHALTAAAVKEQRKAVSP